MPLRASVEISEEDHLVLATRSGELKVEGDDDLRLQDDLFDVARATLFELGREGLRCRIAFDSEIPRQSGLGGSTSLVVALLRAVLEWRGQSLPPHRLAEWARRIERHVMGIQCGFSDQYMAVFGGLRFMDFRGKQFDEDDEEAPFATVESIAGMAPGVPFVLAFTGVRHASGSVHKPIRERWMAGEPAVRAAYERVAEIGALGKRAYLLGDWKRLGSLMNENHAIQRDLGGSGESNERLIAAALEAGAPGAKLAGAGDGGTIVALWSDPDATPLEAKLREAGAAELYRPSVEPGVRID